MHLIPLTFSHLRYKSHKINPSVLPKGLFYHINTSRKLILRCEPEIEMESVAVIRVIRRNDIGMIDDRLRQYHCCAAAVIRSDVPA